jgi:hypothetical protein
MVLLTVFFKEDNTFSVLKANSKVIKSISATDEVTVTSGKKTYTGLVIGRTGVLFFSEPAVCNCVSQLVLAFAFSISTKRRRIFASNFFVKIGNIAL